MADAYFMFNVAVFSFCIFSNNHQIHIAMSTKQSNIVKNKPVYVFYHLVHLNILYFNIFKIYYFSFFFFSEIADLQCNSILILTY